jgi:hypothetical protein
MPLFTFEYSRTGETPHIADRIEIEQEAAIWCHVEALALRIGQSPGAFIRVRNAGGQPIVRAGVATALASIAQCPCGGCAVKEAARGGRLLEGPLRLSPCRGLGACSCQSFTRNACLD